MCDDDEPFEVPEEVVLPVEDSLDLHTFRPRDVKDVVENYIDEALAAGFHEVRVIHGRGIGVQREIVRKTLERHPSVLDYADAPPGHGGWGATIARLGIPPGGEPGESDEQV
jgi:dsDNA-specific endonuclease/ATPase MutS2